MLNKEQKEFIRKNSNKLTIRELAKILTCSYRQVANYCYYNGLYYKPHKLTQENIDYIIENHQKFTIAEFSKLFNVKMSYIERIFKKFNLIKKKKDKNKLTFTEVKIIEVICVKGVFINKELAKAVNVKLSTIKKHLINIYRKTNSHSMTELVFKYYNNHLTME